MSSRPMQARFPGSHRRCAGRKGAEGDEAERPQKQLVVAGGVSANKQLATLDDEAKRKRLRVYYPELEFCTDNGAMIALAGCLRLQAGTPAKEASVFAVQPRWPLMDMSVSGKKTAAGWRLVVAGAQPNGSSSRCFSSCASGNPCTADRTCSILLAI